LVQVVWLSPNHQSGSIFDNRANLPASILADFERVYAGTRIDKWMIAAREFRVMEGDALTVLRTLPAESVHCCITSPPYFGLRDYGTAQWAGGDAACDHLMPPNGGDKGRDRAASNGTFHDSPIPNQIRQQFSRVCGKCGAKRIDAQIGLERTPAEYVARLVAVFREVRRVLRADGTAWVNLGDSYASNPASGGAQSSKMTGGEHKHTPMMNGYRRPDDLKPKDLCGIPWRVAFALQADGWYLRSDIIWAKPNPMPESVTDRPTKAHEYIFLLAKSERYFYDADAVAEATTDEEYRTVGKIRPSLDTFAVVDPEKARTRFNLHVQPGGRLTRNRRTVWTQATQAYPESHFATFPEELIRPCVLAGCPIGGVVLDPFCGSGTTGVVACGLDRAFIGIELNASYAAMARNRIQNDQPLFNKMVM